MQSIQPKSKRRLAPARVFFAVLCSVLLPLCACGCTAAHASAHTKSAASSGAAEPRREVPRTPVIVSTTRRVPVLMYHSINYEKGNTLRVPRDKFAAQMKWLYDNGYKTLSLDELYGAVKNDSGVPEKSVVLTFDDGYADNYTNALPVILQYGFKATVFMITSKIGDTKNGYLSAEQLREMDRSGMRVESHTVSHPDLRTLCASAQRKELSGAKETLERLLGREVFYLAYPAGKYNAASIQTARQLGYRLCFKTGGGAAGIGQSDAYAFPRIFVGEGLADFIQRVKGNAS